jgi:hypothetical protein
VLRRLLLVQMAITLMGCAAEPKDVTMFSDFPQYYASILVGGQPGKCLVVESPLSIRSFIPCGSVVGFIRDEVHPPAGGSLYVGLRGDDNTATWRALNNELTVAGFRPTF